MRVRTPNYLQVLHWFRAHYWKVIDNCLLNADLATKVRVASNVCYSIYYRLCVLFRPLPRLSDANEACSQLSARLQMLTTVAAAAAVSHYNLTSLRSLCWSDVQWVTSRITDSRASVLFWSLNTVWVWAVVVQVAGVAWVSCRLCRIVWVKINGAQGLLLISRAGKSWVKLVGAYTSHEGSPTVRYGRYGAIPIWN